MVFTAVASEPAARFFAVVCEFAHGSMGSKLPEINGESAADLAGMSFASLLSEPSKICTIFFGHFARPGGSADRAGILGSMLRAI